MTIYKPFKNETLLHVNESYLGESIEEQMRRATESKEKIEVISPIIYTERKDGVLPQYDIRTDRFDIACEAMGKVAASHIAKRQQRIERLNTTNEEPSIA